MLWCAICAIMQWWILSGCYGNFKTNQFESAWMWQKQWCNVIGPKNVSRSFKMLFHCYWLLAVDWLLAASFLFWISIVCFSHVGLHLMVFGVSDLDIKHHGFNVRSFIFAKWPKSATENRYGSNSVMMKSNSHSINLKWSHP